MNTLQEAYARWAFLRRRYGRAVNWRVSRRFKLGELAAEDSRTYDRICARMEQRRERLTDELEQAEAVVNGLWHGHSCRLDPIADYSESFALPRTICAQQGETDEWYGSIEVVLCSWNRLSAGWW